METENNSPANDNTPEEDGGQVLDFWSDEGARIYNEMIAVGSEYLAANPHSAEKYKEDLDEEECEYLDSNLGAPDA